MFTILNAQVNLDNGKTLKFNQFRVKKENGSILFEADVSQIAELEKFVLQIKTIEDIQILLYDVQTNTTTCRTSYGLAKDKSVVVNVLPEKKPESLLAMYLFNDWWTRPAFVKETQVVPKRTTSLLTKDTDGYTYYLPLTGKISKTEIAGCEEAGALSLEVSTGVLGLSNAHDLVAAIAYDGNVNRSIAKAFQTAAKQHPSHPLLKDAKRFPEIFDSLGWCSWDAFYTNINEEGVLAKADEFLEKGIPVNWMILDDGWLSVKDGCLTSFEEDRSKFPNGFASLTEKLRNDKGIHHVGVWHAIGGYWGGIDPESPLYEKQRHHLYKTVKGKALPHYEYDKGFGFWNDWYEYLRGSGIDFVKTDGQGAIKNYYNGEKSIGQAAYGTHRGLEGAVCSYFDGRMINCMGMEPENMWNRTITAVSRNSDDFVPNNEKGFAEHLLQNAYNSLYHSQLYFGDWDMYWTDHFDAERHAILRAISGGPIYFSDKVGHTNKDVIMPLVYLDGRILRCDESGIPSEDCLFTDPSENNTLIKIVNRIGSNGVMALFSLTGQPAEGTVSPSDVYWLEDGEYLVYDYFKKTVISLNRTDKISYVLNGYGAGFVTFIKKQGYCTPIGLTDKYAGIHCILRHDEFENAAYTLIKESGSYAFTSERMPKSVYANGKDVTNLLTVQENYYVLHLNEENQETGILINFE